MSGFSLSFMARHPEAEGGLVKLSQQRLDELLNRAFAKGARRGAKAPADGAAPRDGGAPGGDTGDSVISLPGAAESGGTAAETGVDAGEAPVRAKDGGADARGTNNGGAPAGAAREEALAELAQAKATLASANARLLEAMVLREAQNLRISQRGVQAAMKLCDFAPCLAGGAPDGQLVKAALGAFAQNWPEFQLSAPPAPFAAGPGSDAIQQDTLKNALGVVG